MSKKRFLSISCLMLMATSSAAAPIGDCPVDGFLLQGTTASLYSVNLASGYYNVLAGPGLRDESSMLEEDFISSDKGKLNALGYSVHDNYLYAWHYDQKTLARIGNDYRAEPLNVFAPDGFYFSLNDYDPGEAPLPNFFVGDVSPDPDDQAYYVYSRASSARGLFKIDLVESTVGDDLGYQMTRIANTSSIDLRIYDFAFHPNYTQDNTAYSVDLNGDLISLSSTGVVETVGNVGVEGTFGAVYFDADGYLYIGRNHDGKIFRVDVDQALLDARQGLELETAQLVAQGPKSSTNDGARCVNQDVNSVAVLQDFSDAPASYGNASHQQALTQGSQTNTVWLGSRVDSEGGAFNYPLSDDESSDVNDEDGIQFVTPLEEGQWAVIEVRVSELSRESGTVGYLNVWLDVNGDGVFLGAERMLTNHAVVDGKNMLFFEIPDGVTAESIDTWARFRLTSEEVAGEPSPSAAAADGEVEDYRVQLIASEESARNTNYFPSPQGYVTLVYEDNWPLKGDYDLNDLVVYYRAEQLVENDQIISTRINGRVAALGAGYRSGFAIRLPGVSKEQIDQAGMNLILNGVLIQGGLLEETRDVAGELAEEDAIFIISEDLLELVRSGEDCLLQYRNSSGYVYYEASYYRTLRGCDTTISIEFELNIPFSGASPVTTADLPLGVYDPFMFASPGQYRGGLFETAPGRSLEIHLQDKGFTAAMDVALFDVEDVVNEEGEVVYDVGDASSKNPEGVNFVTARNMPWAMQFNTEWKYPTEFQDILYVYYRFDEFILSAGTEYTDWFNYQKDGYANQSKIYLD